MNNNNNAIRAFEEKFQDVRCTEFLGYNELFLIRNSNTGKEFFVYQLGGKYISELYGHAQLINDEEILLASVCFDGEVEIYEITDKESVTLTPQSEKCMETEFSGRIYRIIESFNIYKL